jgi:hypothetical protein
VDWPTLDALSQELQRFQTQGRLQGLPPVPVFGIDETLDADVMGRIVLADVDHVRERERTHPAETNWAKRRLNLARQMQLLLDIAEAKQALYRSSERS